ncbi:MAG: divergent polysaccharide deacetylase family protein [Desulfuromonadaceae bacterium]|nr:divergent polysaccharide deacetylase family protein [Desulfuromonadaceae bacterium]
MTRRKKPTSQKKRPQQKTAPAKYTASASLKTLLSLLFIGGLVLVGLVLVARLPQPAAPGYPAPAATKSLVITEEIEIAPQPDLTVQPPATQPVHRPRLAIIMDDLGEDLARARQVVELKVPVTLAIIPDLSHSCAVMELATAHQHEVMVHLPMEPLGYPQHNPGAQALFVALDDGEIRQRTRHFLDALPDAVGCNNHMGSAFTARGDKMTPALEEIHQSGLFFVDSLTCSNSVAAQNARQLGIPTAKRDVFLDNITEVNQILARLEQLAQTSQAKGEAIGICHPYPQTLVALQQFAPRLEELGIEAVYASQLVR